MTRLIPVHELAREHNLDLTGGVYDPTGKAAYGAGGQKIGTVRGALAEPQTGRLRYLIVDVGGWFSSKEVVVPVGMARLEDDAVYFDNLEKAQVQQMRPYRAGEAYEGDAQISDERVLRGADYTGNIGHVEEHRDFSALGTAEGMTASAAATGAELTPPAPVSTYNYRDEDAGDTLFKTPQQLRLLEERLLVNKERFVAGSVQISKHVENREQQVSVNLTHEELVVERHPVTDPRPVEGNVTLGAGSETVRVDLEAERADVRKQAYVAEEVEVGKRTETETRTFSETVGREVLDVNKTGDVTLDSADGGKGKGLLERTEDAVEGGLDRLSGEGERGGRGR